MEISQKIKNISTIWSRNSAPVHLSKGNVNRIPKRYMHHIVYCIAVLFTIAKIWKQPQYSPTDKWIKKMSYYTHTHICMHNGILLTHEKEGNSAICDYTDGMSGHYVEWEKSEENSVRYHLHV